MKRSITILLAVFTMLGSSAALADSHPGKRLDDATEVLRQFVNIPENAIPPALLRQAYGIAVIPSVIKAGFIFGARYGKGVVAVRTKDGGWSNPVFISLVGGSIGWQAGASSTDIILVFKTRRSVERMAQGQFNIGAGASVAAGPVGRSAGASTNLALNAEVYSYARSRGLFAGVSLEGGRLSIDQDADWLFYDKAGIKALTILDRNNTSNIPPPGKRFVYTLQNYMPKSSNKFDYPSTVGGRNQGNSSGQNGNAMQGPAGQTQSADTAGQSQPYGENRGDPGVTVRSNKTNGRNANANGMAESENDSGPGSGPGSGSGPGDQSGSSAGERSPTGRSMNRTQDGSNGSDSGDYGSGANNSY